MRSHPWPPAPGRPTPRASPEVGPGHPQLEQQGAQQRQADPHHVVVVALQSGDERTTEATLKEMEQQVRAAWAVPKNPEAVGRIYLKADGLAPYESVYPVLMYLNKNMDVQSIDLAIAKDSKGED